MIYLLMMIKMMKEIKITPKQATLISKYYYPFNVCCGLEEYPEIVYIDNILFYRWRD